jgi:hypothetical protein
MSWQIKDDGVLSELIVLMGISVEEQALLGDLADAAKALAPAMVEAFYGRLMQHEATAEYLHGTPMERLHGTAARWFSELFCGKYDADYARQRMTIGHIHARIGLPVRYPLAMIDVVLPFGEAVATQSPHPLEAQVAFRKVLALDIAVFNQAYEDHHLRHLAELVGGERLARRLLTGEA